MQAQGHADKDFAGFVRARGPALQRTAYLLTGDWGRAEDLLQTCLARCHPKWDRIRLGDPEAYVRASLANTSATWWRRRWHAERPTEQLPDQASSDRWSAVDDRLMLAAAIARLPPRQRAVLVLRFHEDMTEAAVAAALHCHVGTVKSQTAKALATLRRDAALSGADPQTMTTRST